MKRPLRFVWRRFDGARRCGFAPRESVSAWGSNQASLIDQLLPESEAVMIEGGGHVLFAERPAEYQKVPGDWLDKTL